MWVLLPIEACKLVCSGLYLELLCGLLKETSAGLEQRLGGGKAAREWDRMFTKARYTYMYIHVIHLYGCTSLSSPVYLVCDALVEVLWLLCIVYVIRAQPAELPR